MPVLLSAPRLVTRLPPISVTPVAAEAFSVEATTRPIDWVKAPVVERLTLWPGASITWLRSMSPTLAMTMPPEVMLVSSPSAVTALAPPRSRPVAAEAVRTPAVMIPPAWSTALSDARFTTCPGALMSAVSTRSPVLVETLTPPAVLLVKDPRAPDTLFNSIPSTADTVSRLAVTSPPSWVTELAPVRLTDWPFACTAPVSDRFTASFRATPPEAVLTAPRCVIALASPKVTPVAAAAFSVPAVRISPVA